MIRAKFDNTEKFNEKGKTLAEALNYCIKGNPKPFDSKRYLALTLSEENSDMVLLSGSIDDIEIMICLAVHNLLLNSPADMQVDIISELKDMLDATLKYSILKGGR